MAWDDECSPQTEDCQNNSGRSKNLFSFLHLFDKCSEISFIFENTVVECFTQHDE
jgi:hypothetical protein